MLTPAIVKRARSNGRRREISDGSRSGLRMIINAGGKKVFALRVKQGGKQTKLFLGPCLLIDDPLPSDDAPPILGQPLTLNQARQLAAMLNVERAKGASLRAKHHQGVTFAQAVTRYCDYIEQHKRNRTAPVVRRILEAVCERWGNLLVASIVTDDVDLLITEARDLGVPGRKARTSGPSDGRTREMAAILSAFFRFCLRKRLVKFNPADALDKPRVTVRDRVLSDAELRTIWKACSTVGRRADVVKVLLLTAQRRTEIGGMTLDEIYGDVLVLPAHRTKNKREHRVFLSPMAREIIGDDWPKVTGWSKLKLAIDDEIENPFAWRLHDLRRTAATRMCDLGVDQFTVERILNHTLPQLQGTYNRSKAEAAARRALQRWSNHVEALVLAASRPPVVKRPPTSTARLRSAKASP